MNLILKLNALVERVREESLIEWQDTNGLSEYHCVYLNEALRAAENETERWTLFLEMLFHWFSEPPTRTASVLFGLKIVLQQREPCVLSRVERLMYCRPYGFALLCNEQPICKISGDLSVIAPHYRELVQKGYALTKRKFEKRKP